MLTSSSWNVKKCQLIMCGQIADNSSILLTSGIKISSPIWPHKKYSSASKRRDSFQMVDIGQCMYWLLLYWFFFGNNVPKLLSFCISGVINWCNLCWPKCPILLPEAGQWRRRAPNDQISSQSWIPVAKSEQLPISVEISPRGLKQWLFTFQKSVKSAEKSLKFWN